MFRKISLCASHWLQKMHKVNHFPSQTVITNGIWFHNLLTYIHTLAEAQCYQNGTPFIVIGLYKSNFVLLHTNSTLFHVTCRPEIERISVRKWLLPWRHQTKMSRLCRVSVPIFSLYYREKNLVCHETVACGEHARCLDVNYIGFRKVIFGF